MNETTKTLVGMGPEDVAMTRAEVLAQYTQDCSFLLYGQCSTLRCLKRGGYTRGCNPNNFTATCAAREAVEKDALTQAAGLPTEPTDEMLLAGVKAFQHARFQETDPLADWRAFYRACVKALTPTKE